MLEYLAIAASYLPNAANIIALLAVIVGPFIQLKIANRQQRASVVSVNRVRWIEDFRREIAEFIAACHLHEAERHYLAAALEDKDEKQIEHYRKAFDASFFRVNTLLHMLRLKLDPDDQERPNDAKIWDLIKRVDELDVEAFKNLNEFEDRFDIEAEHLRKAVRAKLSPEWQRVERLE
jgi:DNA-binding phage protein